MNERDLSRSTDERKDAERRLLALLPELLNIAEQFRLGPAQRAVIERARELMGRAKK